MSPDLFNLILEVMIRLAHIKAEARGEETGVSLNGRPLNNLRFADDIDLVANSQEKLQKWTDRVNDSSRRLGLRINSEKTKTMVIGKQHKDLVVRLEGMTLEQVTKFVYLGGMITEEGGCGEDIRRRIGLASTVFGKLDKMWRTNSVSIKTKLRLYNALVIPVLLYGSECWCLRKEDERRLLVAEMSWLRRIRGRSRRERIRNEITRKELGAEQTVVEKIKKRRLRWFGHVMRMDDKRLPVAALHGHVEGKRSIGRQRKIWMDNVKEDLEEKDIDMRRAIDLTRNREVWRRLIEASSSAHR
jgi:Reverse transcriptase (RNA-dependent DNA polymerase)